MPSQMNSIEWWNDYFASQWEANHGRDQTRHFISKLLENLPAREYRWLSSEPRTILDWGCALGDGVDVLCSELPKCEVSGLDFSRTAIEKAEAFYPHHRFILAEDGAVSSDYDVIITSNCLEHYASPFDVAAQHVDRARYLYIAMVPFEEPEPIHESHIQRFTYESFPYQIGRFHCTSLTIFRPLPQYWNAPQAIACYASPEYQQAKE